jgi:multidrug transporter EmrE-like cation transporter
MNFYDISMLSLVEIIADFALKHFANKGGDEYLAIGAVGYMGVVYFLIRSLRNSTVLLVNGAWDGMSTIYESVAAYVILGERFEYASQYVGLVLIVMGLFLLRIPLK